MPRRRLAEVTRDFWDQVHAVPKNQLVYNNEADGLGYANHRAVGPEGTQGERGARQTDADSSKTPIWVARSGSCNHVKSLPAASAKKPRELRRLVAYVTAYPKKYPQILLKTQ